MSLPFLTLSDVVAVHADQVRRYGGAPGIGDMGLLKSALGMPSASFSGQYLHSDLFEMAAAYLYHLVGNRPFVDGNKRTGAVCAIVFLKLNGHELECSEDDLEALVMGVADGSLQKHDAARFLRTHCTPAEVE